MKRGRAFPLIVAAGLMSMVWVSAVGTAVLTDRVANAGNTFQAWAVTEWVQTTQTDFEAGIRTDVDTAASQGDVRLARATATLGDSANDGAGATMADAVHVQLDGFAAVPYNGEITSWTYYEAGVTSSGARLEFLSGSGTTWTVMAKSGAVAITGTDTFAVSIPVQAGWQLGLYSGSGKVKYDSTGGTVSGRAEASGDLGVSVATSGFSQSSGHLALTAVLRYYWTSGTMASQVLDSGVAGAKWDSLSWDETLQSNTDITFEVRASDTPFALGDAGPSWASVAGTSPVTAGLPSGRYMQWRATLTTSDTSNTPTLHEVRIQYH